MNKRGITLIALTITIVILIILVGVGGTVSVRLIRKGKEQSLVSDMLQIQAKVKIIMERVAFNGDTSIYIGTKLKDAGNKVEIAGLSLTTQELEKDSIYIYDKDTLASIGLDSIKLSSQEVFLVDYSNADIIFPKGCKREDGSTFYRLSEIYNNTQTYTEAYIPVVSFQTGKDTIEAEIFLPEEIKNNITEYQFKIGTTRRQRKASRGNLARSKYI